MMLRSQRQLSRQFWELFVALPEELQSEIMFKQMDIEGASMLRLVSPLFRDTFRLSDAIQYVDLFMSNLVDVYGKMDAVEVVLVPLLKLGPLLPLEVLEVTIVLTEYAPPIEVFLQYSHILLNGLFAQLAQSVNGRYYTRYNYIHIVEMRTAKDVHIRIHIISNGGNGGNGGSGGNGGRRVTINGELIGLRISPTA